jgi:hypothetical protein
MLTTRLIDITFFSTNFLLVGFEPSISRSRSNAIPPSYHNWLIGMFVYYCRTHTHTHTVQNRSSCNVYLWCISSKNINNKYISLQTNLSMTIACIQTLDLTMLVKCYTSKLPLLADRYVCLLLLHSHSYTPIQNRNSCYCIDQWDCS